MGGVICTCYLDCLGTPRGEKQRSTRMDHLGVGPSGFDCNIEFHLVRHVYGDLSSVEAQTTVVLRWGLTRFPDNKEANKI